MRPSVPTNELLDHLRNIATMVDPAAMDIITGNIAGALGLPIDQLRTMLYTNVNTPNNNLKDYFVSIAVDTRYHAHVRAENTDDAKEKAINRYMTVCNVGDLEVVGYSPVNCEDKDGNITDYN